MSYKTAKYIILFLSKVETEPSKFNYKKVKQQNKKGESDGGNQGSHLAPGKTVQRQRLVVMGERLTEGASLSDLEALLCCLTLLEHSLRMPLTTLTKILGEHFLFIMEH